MFGKAVGRLVIVDVRSLVILKFITACTSGRLSIIARQRMCRVSHEELLI